ncbi:MAG: ABC transporter permease [Propionibacteriaceae bacterium]|jgi:ABC-2 type transport system permease protein|nr:ABC transporter permease [Propionibacteriaceae bacterium]
MTAPAITETAGFSLASPRLTRVRREVNATVAVMARDITITLRSPGTLLMSLAMPLVMMGLIGGNLMQNMASGLHFEFGEFMLVGMLVNMLFMMTTMGMINLIDDTDNNFSSELLVSPVSRYSIVIGKILGSSFSAIISSLGVLVVGFAMGIELGPWQLLALLALSPLMCLAGGALAVIAMGVIKNRKAANMVVMFITMPQMFLSGVIIPIGSSSGVLFVLSRILPMTYCVDLGRAVVYAGTPSYADVVLFNPAVSLVAIAALTAVFLVIGTWLYARSEKDK